MGILVRVDEILDCITPFMLCWSPSSLFNAKTRIMLITSSFEIKESWLYETVNSKYFYGLKRPAVVG